MGHFSLPSLGTLNAFLLLLVACSPAAGLPSEDEEDGVNGDGDRSSGDGDSNLVIRGSGGSGVQGDGDAPAADCDSVIELIIRDFNADHPDFQAFNGGQGEVGCGMVKPTLDLSNGSRTPVFFGGSGSGRRDVDVDGIITCTPWDEYYTGPSEITSAQTFADWFNNVDGVNSQINFALNLSLNPATGTYVFDSANSAGFFPVDGLGFNEVTENHNSHFTTEAHIRFGYEARQKFTFSGDDDLWIFVNGRLALDLGGMHSPITATIDFDAQATALGISPGNTYNMDIFHAERHTSASNFRVETNITCFETVQVPVIR